MDDLRSCWKEQERERMKEMNLDPDLQEEVEMHEATRRMESFLRNTVIAKKLTELKEYIIIFEDSK